MAILVEDSSNIDTVGEINEELSIQVGHKPSYDVVLLTWGYVNSCAEVLAGAGYYGTGQGIQYPQEDYPHHHPPPYFCGYLMQGMAYHQLSRKL